MASNFTRTTSPRFLRENIEIIRNTMGGELRCVTCHGPAVTKGDFANVVGVSPSTLSKWMRREPIRQDIADKLRNAVKAVHE